LEVSERGDILSPKNVPEQTAAAAETGLELSSLEIFDIPDNGKAAKAALDKKQRPEHRAYPDGKGGYPEKCLRSCTNR
jgi:hypothetical protein